MRNTNTETSDTGYYQQYPQNRFAQNVPTHMHSYSNASENHSNPSRSSNSTYVQPLYANAPPKPRRRNDGYSSPSPEYSNDRYSQGSNERYTQYPGQVQDRFIHPSPYHEKYNQTYNHRCNSHDRHNHMNHSLERYNYQGHNHPGQQFQHMGQLVQRCDAGGGRPVEQYHYRLHQSPSIDRFNHQSQSLDGCTHQQSTTPDDHHYDHYHGGPHDGHYASDSYEMAVAGPSGLSVQRHQHVQGMQPRHCDNHVTGRTSRNFFIQHSGDPLNPYVYRAGTQTIPQRENVMQNLERRTPDTYGRSHHATNRMRDASDYEDVYSDEGMYRRPLSPVAYSNIRRVSPVASIALQHRPYNPVYMSGPPIIRGPVSIKNIVPI